MTSPTSFDRPLAVTVAALLSIGLVMVYSASIATGTATGIATEPTHTINYHDLVRQLLHIAFGTLILILTALIKPTWLQRASRPLLVLAMLLLAVLFVPTVGIEVNGSLRWFAIGTVRIQPSELMKFATVIYFADYFTRKRAQLHTFRVGILNVGIIVGFIGILLIFEPDFGSVVVIAFTVAVMMFLAGVRLWHLCTSITIATALMAALIYLEPYRLERFSTYRNPWDDPFGSSFQLTQALIAIGRGDWFGSGLGNSIQKLNYLPHARNDFLIAIIGEELGVVGIFVVLALYIFLLWRAFAIARQALTRGHLFAGLLAQGIGLLFTFQAIIHTGVNIGLLPTKGLTLPLMSYGGSSMLACMAAIGLLFAVHRHTQTPSRQPS